MSGREQGSRTGVATWQQQLWRGGAGVSALPSFWGCLSTCCQQIRLLLPGEHRHNKKEDGSKKKKKTNARQGQLLVTES